MWQGRVRIFRNIGDAHPKVGEYAGSGGGGCGGSCYGDGGTVVVVGGGGCGGCGGKMFVVVSGTRERSRVAMALIALDVALYVMHFYLNLEINKAHIRENNPPPRTYFLGEYPICAIHVRRTHPFVRRACS